MNHKKGTDRSRMSESIVYMVMWLVLFIFPGILELIASAKGNEFEWRDIIGWWIALLPFAILFLVNNFYLIPRFLSTHRYKAYILSVAVALAVFSVYQYVNFKVISGRMEAERQEILEDSLARPSHGLPPLMPMNRSGHGPHRHMIPLPVLLNVFLGMLVLGFNLGISLFFKSYREQEVRSELESMRLQEELKYLKTQINPHFFMNMLNNIHAMIEIDPVKAQDMVIELSKLMRYVLYEGDNSSTTFAREVRFISSYISLMRRRYPADKVDIQFVAPSDPSDSVKLPPLLFISFIENAFKHGVSYMKASMIKVNIKESDGMIDFCCRNTKANADASVVNEGGVGLENVKRRLDLLYDARYELEIDETEEEYTVMLKLPCL